MTKETHTQGPWTVEHDPVWPWDIHISPDILTMKRAAYSTRAKTIEDMRQAVGFLGSERDEAIKAIAVQEADANLIAAAPDLLEALKAMVLNDPYVYRDCHQAALAAIAKATGQSKA